MTDQLPYTHNCFVCGVDNPHGLQVRFSATDNEVRTEYVPREPHAGYRGLVHGGVLAAALDEAMFWAASHTNRRFHVSAEITVRYKQMVRVAEDYEIVARTVKSVRAMCLTEAELLDSRGALCATATGKYLPLPAEDIPRVLEDFHPDDETVRPQSFVGGDGS